MDATRRGSGPAWGAPPFRPRFLSWIAEELAPCPCPLVRDREALGRIDRRSQCSRAPGAGGAPIDLVSLNDASIVLAHEIVESGSCLFALTADIQTEFVTRARARYWDFEPYRKEHWRLAGERLGERRRGHWIRSDPRATPRARGGPRQGAFGFL